MNDLPKTMKALVAYGNGDYRLETAYPVPECGEDDIIIKTEGCGICAGPENDPQAGKIRGIQRFWGTDYRRLVHYRRSKGIGSPGFPSQPILLSLCH